MAETKKKNTSGKKSASGGKKASSGRSGAKKQGGGSNASGPDLLTIVVVVVAVVLVAALIINYNNEKKKNQETGKTPTTAVTQPPKKETPEPTKEPEPTNPASPTAAPTGEPTESPQPTDEPVPTEEVFLPRKEAEALLTAQLNKELYQTELLSDYLPIDGKTYYLFCINDRDGKTYEPLVIVEKKVGTIYYYDASSGTISDFTKFPLDETETQGAGETKITAEQAIEILKQFSPSQLGLAKEFADYEMKVDDWPTTVRTKECYCINVFEVKDGKERLRGSYYVSQDGKNVFMQNPETGDFVTLTK